jgi:hypothetical protein
MKSLPAILSLLGLAACARVSMEVSTAKNDLEASIQANEAAAISGLGSICTAEETLRISLAIDVNRDGTGEYGFFGELLGSSAVRTDENGGVGEEKVRTAPLSAGFRQVASGRVIRGGYVYQIYLPDENGQPVAEADGGGADGVSISATKSASSWCCYAWPLAYGKSGRRAFFANQTTHQILQTRNDVMHYSGSDKAPGPFAAFPDGAEDMTLQPAAGAVGGDGQPWGLIGL